MNRVPVVVAAAVVVVAAYAVVAPSAVIDRLAQLCPSPAGLRAFAGVMAVVTIACVLSLGAAALARRDAAARHAALAWGLVLVVVSPLAPAVAEALGCRPFTFAPDRIGIGNLEPPAGGTADPPGDSHVDAAGANSGAGRQFSVAAIGGACVALWAAGAMLGLAGTALAAVRAMRWRRRATPVSDRGLVGAARAARRALGEGLRAPVRVRVSDDLPGPASVGLWRPVVLIPRHLCGALTRSQWRDVFLHEFAHGRRRDHVIALLQRGVAAILWPHPMIHLLCRALARAREEVCDNHVLSHRVRRGGRAGQRYARALLRIAEMISARAAATRRGAGPISNQIVAASGTSLALAMPPWNLERRVTGLLDPRRSLMTRSNPRWSVGAALALACASLFVARVGIGRAADAPATQRDARPDADRSHAVRIELGESEFYDGDAVAITDVVGPSDKLQDGGSYRVKGTYKLASRDQATLLLCVTAAQGPGVARTDPGQSIIVKRGEGAFDLTITLSKGYPHVSFYPTPSGDCFGGVYFGQGDSVLAKKTWSYRPKAKQ